MWRRWVSRGEAELAAASVRGAGFRVLRDVPAGAGAVGDLRVDPEIGMPSVGMDVDIAYCYSASSQANGPFGYGRSMATNLTCEASGEPDGGDVYVGQRQHRRLSGFWVHRVAGLCPSPDAPVCGGWGEQSRRAVAASAQAHGGLLTRIGRWALAVLRDR